MAPEIDPVELIGRRPDERLLAEDLVALPEDAGRPEELVGLPARGRIVALGATLTGVTLLGGLALIVLSVVVAISSGWDAGALAALVAGVALVATHWGWVHVAEAGAQALEARHNHAAIDRRGQWLESIEPYTRWSATTATGEDGSIAILIVRHRPVPSDQDRYTFEREITGREIHSGDEPAAAVTERAELLRRRAAAATATERERYIVAHDAYEQALIATDDEQQRLAALRAASTALSEQINTHLRDPPLTE
ncbi:MAG: hypothetical protein ACRDMJ_15535 [Solirubrobacteraceae bacterium]